MVTRCHGLRIAHRNTSTFNARGKGRGADHHVHGMLCVNLKSLFQRMRLACVQLRRNNAYNVQSMLRSASCGSAFAFIASHQIIQHVLYIIMQRGKATVNVL